MTVRSMTGLGSAQCDSVSVEVRSVNHRNLDIRLQVPEGWKTHELALSKMVRQTAERGSVTMSIAVTCESLSILDRKELEARLAQWQFAADHLGRNEEAPLAWVLSGMSARPTVADITDEVIDCVHDALRSWNAEREREGRALAGHMHRLIKIMRHHLGSIEQSEVHANHRYQERLRQRIETLVGDRELDETRLIQEVAVMAERRDVAEERIRISAHLDAIEAVMASDEAAGRKVGFIAQELLREVNTIGSKAQDLTMTEHVVALKVVIEQLREQVLNVE